MDDNAMSSVYIPAAICEVTSKFWQDFLSARVSPDKLARILDKMDDDDPNWADVQAVYDQIMEGFTMEARKAGFDCIVFGIHVWNYKSLTEASVKAMDAKLRGLA